MPGLDKLSKRFADDVVVIGISDESGRWSRIPGEEQALLPAGDRPEGTVNNALQIRGIPHAIVLSTDGVVRWQGHPGEIGKLSAAVGAVVRADPGVAAQGGPKPKPEVSDRGPNDRAGASGWAWSRVVSRDPARAGDPGTTREHRADVHRCRVCCTWSGRWGSTRRRRRAAGRAGLLAAPQSAASTTRSTSACERSSRRERRRVWLFTTKGEPIGLRRRVSQGRCAVFGRRRGPAG